MRKKYIFIAISIIFVIWISFVIVGRNIPIHKSDLSIGSKNIFYIETSRLVHCDIASLDIVLYEEGTTEYAYQLISTGNGSCVSDLYVWHKMKSYTLSEALALDIISLEDFLSSDFVIERPISTE